MKTNGWTRTELIASLIWHAILAGLATLVLTLLYTASAHASTLEFGISDTWTPIEQRNQWATDINARWERITVSVGQDDVAQRIRQIHAAGRHVILTVGGNGTTSRKPSFTAALAYIQTLPRADRYTIDNEPDLDGTNPCVYRKGWMAARRVLGRKLLFGDFSPHHPVTFTARVKRCGPLPKHLDIALHPYSSTDPLAPCGIEGGIGNLGRMTRAFARMGVTASWWLDEFGYVQSPTVDPFLADQWTARMWTRAIKQAQRHHAKVLIVYAAQGRTWDTRPRAQTWEAIRTAM